MKKMLPGLVVGLMLGAGIMLSDDTSSIKETVGVSLFFGALGSVCSAFIIL